MPDTATSLYEQDFYLWTRRQAKALRQAARAGSNLPLDWENLAEEIESLGRSDRRELRSRITTIIEHLLKLQFSPAGQPRAGWAATIARNRGAIESDLLKESPSLRREVQPMIDEQMPKAAQLVGIELQDHGEVDEAAREGLLGTTYSAAQVLGDWWPDEAADA